MPNCGSNQLPIEDSNDADGNVGDKTPKAGASDDLARKPSGYQANQQNDQ